MLVISSCDFERTNKQGYNMVIFSTNKKTDGKWSMVLPNFGNLPSCYIEVGQNKKKVIEQH